MRIMDKQIAELEGKLKTLNFRLKKTGNVSKKDDRTAFERHKVSVEALVMAVVKLKKSIEEQKFANCEDDEAVQEWANEIEKKLLTRGMPVYANWQNELNKSIVI